MSKQAQATILPGLMSGKISTGFVLSEPGAGSDALMIKTRAVADKGGWRINKIWRTNSPYAQYLLIFAVTDPER